MKRLLTRSVLLLALLTLSDAALPAAAQDRRPQRRGAQAARPTPTPTPQPTPAAALLRETPLPPGGRARF